MDAVLLTEAPCLLSQQDLDLPESLKALYKTVWEIKQRVLVDMAADRGAYIDQSQSFNVHMSDPNFGKLTSLHFYGWKVIPCCSLHTSPSLLCVPQSPHWGCQALRYLQTLCVQMLWLLWYVTCAAVVFQCTETSSACGHFCMDPYVLSGSIAVDCSCVRRCDVHRLLVISALPTQLLTIHSISNLGNIAIQ